MNTGIGARVYKILILEQHSGEWTRHVLVALPHEKVLVVPIGQEAGWAAEPVWTQKLEEKSSAPVGDRTPVVQFIVRHYTD
jgi:hypothetical protein